ncbi:MAG TPA: SRPBCC domain-containing protein [Acidimicrobiia bacterium]|nr:SRPBCC domain-containing protein [Acidimicrobiia bacterium]
MTDELTLHLERRLRARRPEVFAAHVDADELARWWGPKGFTARIVDLDVRVGGRYRIVMQPPDGATFALSGVYRAVDPPARLVYTFAYDDPDPDDRETIVEFSLRDLGDETEVTVEQGPFATEARRALHQQGWTEILDRLEDVTTNRRR